MSTPPGGRTSVTVSVPATSANLGPGFDALGIALDLREELTVRRLDEGAARPQIVVRGVAPHRVPHDENLLAYRAVAAVYQRIGRPLPALALDLFTRIPKSGGLGGTGAAIVGGVVAANELEGRPLTTAELLDVAVGVEGHPDNVSPALLGGLVVSVHGRRGLIAKRLEPRPALSAVVCIPDRAVSTKAARDLIPRQLSREDTVFNLSRTALFVAAFQTGDWPLLRDAMDDRLHQPARGQILPILFPVIDAACGAGAHGAALSGSGAAILALATERHEAIAQAMHAAAAERGFPNRCLHLALSPTGAQVIG